MTEPTFDALLGRLEQPAQPAPAFADALFARLAVDAGLREGEGGWRRTFPRWSGETPAPARWLAWAAVLAAVLVVMAGLLVVGAGREAPSLPPATPIASPAPAAPSPGLHVGSSVLSVGAVPPAWTGTRIDGRTFSTADLAGRPAAVLIWCSCVPGPQARLFADSATARGGEIAFALVSVDLDGTTRGLADQLATAMPIVSDPQARLLDAWGLEGFPELVLLRADGTLADIQPQTFDNAKLASLLDALVAGGPIPDPVVKTPSPTTSAGLPPVTTVLEAGAPAPVLTGRLLGGGERSTQDLRGRPLVVVFFMPPRRDGTPLDDTPLPDAAFLAQFARRGGDARLLIVTEAEAQGGDTRRYLDRVGFDGDVVADWTGQLEAAWGLTYTPSVVALDADGRVLRVAGPEAMSNPAMVLDGLPTPSPSG